MVAVRVKENVALLPGGQTVILTDEEVAALERGEEVTVATARGQYTPVIGQTREGA